MKYDIFISYRNDGGEFAGKAIYDRLKADGYSCFYAIETMGAGKFNDQLYSVIGEAEDVLVILSPNALDRCADPDDWVRREIAYAIRCKKNIIPVMLRNFQWPKTLPSDMEDLRYYEGIKLSSDGYEHHIERLKRLLNSKPTQAGCGSCELLYNPMAITELMKIANSEIVMFLTDYHRTTDETEWLKTMTGIFVAYLENHRDVPLRQHLDALSESNNDVFAILAKGSSNRSAAEDPLEMEQAREKAMINALCRAPVSELNRLLEFFRTLYGSRQMFYVDRLGKSNMSLPELVLPEPTYMEISYKDRVYLGRDVFVNLGDQKHYIYAISREKADAFPEIVFFERSENGSLRKVLKDNETDYIGLLISYSIYYRGSYLSCSMHEYHFSRSQLKGKESRELAEANRYMKQLSLIYDTLEAHPDIQCKFALPQTSLFGKTRYALCEVSTKRCIAFDYDTRKTKRIPPFGDLLVVDMIRTQLTRPASALRKGEYSYYVLGLEKNKKTHAVRFAVYEIVISEKTVVMAPDHEFNVCSRIREAPLGELDTGVLERFALQVELIKSMCLDNCVYKYPEHA